jgi:Alcohol dehydrogenase GroES-associated
MKALCWYGTNDIRCDSVWAAHVGVRVKQSDGAKIINAVALKLGRLGFERCSGERNQTS